MSAHRPIDPAGVAAAADLAPDLASALAAAPYLPSRKLEGWSAPRQRQFLELIAIGHSVEAAARTVGLSHQSAYAFRASARGAVFALGWHAALLLARDRLADTLLARAFEGQTVTITRADGSVVERHFHDNRLAMAALTRLDRMADADPGAACSGGPGIHAARLAAQEWDGFLDLIEAERGPARAALFLARRSGGGGEGAHALEPIAALARADLRLRAGAGDPAEVDIADLDPAARAGWSAGQWARAEAAGLLRLAPPPAKPDGNPQPPQHSQPEEFAEPGPADGVWYDEDLKSWQTQFPPPPGFDGEADGDPGDEDYRRSLSPDEEALLGEVRALELAVAAEAGAIDRDRWFAELAEDIAALHAARVEPGEVGGEAEGGTLAIVAAASADTPSCLPGEGRGPVGGRGR